MRKNAALDFTFILLFNFLFLSLFSGFSEAIPAFARKYNLTCTVCHTKPPRLNPFGEAFHMAGFQIPMTEGGEVFKKRKIGRVNLETNLLNVFALRANGNFIESFQKKFDGSQFDIMFPNEIALYMAGTITQDISYFFELENEAIEVEGNVDEYESTSRFGIGKEFFVMFNLDPYVKNPFSKKGHGKKMMRGPHAMMAHGPMVMIGKIDPSTNFSHSTNRQFLLNIPGDVDSGSIKRFAITPYAFASKFFGMKTGSGNVVEVTKQSLYNSTGDFGVDVHGMIGPFLYQVGAMQGLKAGFRDDNENKDLYLMGRFDWGEKEFYSGSISGLFYWGDDTGKVSRSNGSTDTVFIDWLRYGVAGNIKYRLFDIYGAFIWDKIKNLPAETQSVFDDSAFGITVEADYLATDKLMLTARYDQLNAGGFSEDKEDGRLISLQARYYVRDNFSLFLRDTYNLKGETTNPLNSFHNMITFGVDLDF